MATETVNHDTGNRIGTTAEAMQQRALRFIEAMRAESERAFAVAAAGRAYVGDSITERCLFETIEEILSDTTLESELKRTIEEMASLAKEVCHG